MRRSQIRWRLSWRSAFVLSVVALTTAPASAELVGLWRFDEAASPQPDSSGNGHDAVPSGEVAWANDPERGGVYEFNGGNGIGDDYLEVEDTDLLSIEGDLTIAAWAKFNQFDEWNGIVSKTGLPDEGNHNRPAPYDVYLVNGGNGVPRLFVGSGDGNIGNFDAEVPPELEEWTHIAVTINEDGEVLHYLNGEINGEGFIENERIDLDQNLYIGGRADFTTNILEGALDDVAIFNEVLDEAAIGTILSGDFSAYITGGLTGDFDGDSALTAADIDALTDAVLGNANPPEFDLNGDSAVDSLDRDVWVQQLAGTYFGDSNLDGEFNSSDFVQVFTRGTYEDAEAQNSRWGDGDWDGDLEFTSSDFVKAFTGGGYETGPRQGTAAVPEPSGLILLMLGVGVILRRHRRANVST